MRVHHLNCISTCPVGGRLMDDRTESIVQRGELSCHCLLLESDRGLVLVDTGFGTGDVADPRSRLSAFFLALLSPAFAESLTAVRQIERMGLDPRDVRHIVMTHLDFDPAGGLDDFPHATVHMLASERDAAVRRATMLDRMRYRPQQWGTREGWKVNERGGERWLGLERVRELEGVGPDVLLIPLIGHTFGHCGVAVRRERGWLLLAGDAYFFRHELDEDPWCTPGLRFYQWMMEKDRAQRLANQARLRELRREHPEIEIVSSHDIVEFERMAGRSARVPASMMAAQAAPAI